MQSLSQMIQYRSDGSLIRASILQTPVIDRIITESEKLTLVIPIDDAINDPNIWYVDTATKELQAKMTMSPTTAIDSSEVTISNIPDPCTVIWKRQEGVATGGVTTITFDEPGTKSLILKAEPQYLDHNLEVEIP